MEHDKNLFFCNRPINPTKRGWFRLNSRVGGGIMAPPKICSKKSTLLKADLAENLHVD